MPMSNHPHSVQASFKPGRRLSLSCTARLRLKTRVMRHLVARPRQSCKTLEKEWRATYERRDYAELKIRDKLGRPWQRGSYTDDFGARLLAQPTLRCEGRWPGNGEREPWGPAASAN